ncbi:MAG: flagellar export chaperone FlgN [Egibacteraceae bacterium]
MENRELEHVADTLWAEYHIVEYLLFKLVTAKLLLAADDRRFVTPAMDEVGRALITLREAELRRMEALLPMAESWGLPAVELTIADFTMRAPEPMATVFRDLQKALCRSADEIEETAATNCRLASASLAQVHSSLHDLSGTPHVACGGRATSMIDLAYPHTGSASAGGAAGRIDGTAALIDDAQAPVEAATNHTESTLRCSVDVLFAVRTEAEVHLAETVMELQIQELVFAASLEAFAKTLPPGFVHFLRGAPDEQRRSGVEQPQVSLRRPDKG